MTITPSIAFDRSASAHAASAASSASASTTSSSQTSLDSLGGTFMKLLVQELQNQDPTAPMDSTQMVGQMISLNQLDQVASINQLLTSTLGSGSTASSTPAHSLLPITAHPQS